MMFISPQRVGQIARQHGLGLQIGEKRGVWTFSAREVMIMTSLKKDRIRRAQEKSMKPLRDVNPQSTDDQLAALQLQDDMIKRFRAALKREADQMHLLLHDISEGIHHRVDKLDAAWDKKLFLMEEEIKALKRRLGDHNI